MHMGFFLHLLQERPLFFLVSHLFYLSGVKKSSIVTVVAPLVIIMKNQVY